MKYIIFATAILASIFSMSAFGGEATNCLLSGQPGNCLARKSAMFAHAEKSASAKAEGYESLLAAMVKTGLRMDELFARSSEADTDGASISSRWRLALARRLYAIKFGLPEIGIDSVQKLEAMSDAAKTTTKGMEWLAFIDSGCEARELTPPEAMARWEGLLDGLCRLTQADAESLDRDLPGLSALAAPLIQAYNRDRYAADRSMVVSLAVLSEYEKPLAKVPSKRERESIHALLAWGHLLNASAFILMDIPESAAQAVKATMKHLSLANGAGNDPELLPIKAYLSWAMAKAGMPKEAKAQVRAILLDADSTRKISPGIKASALASCIETLSLLSNEK